MTAFPLLPPMQLMECLLRCIPLNNELGGIIDDLEYKKKDIERAAMLDHPYDLEDWEK